MFKKGVVGIIIVVIIGILVVGGGVSYFVFGKSIGQKNCGYFEDNELYIGSSKDPNPSKFECFTNSFINCKPARITIKVSGETSMTKEKEYIVLGKNGNSCEFLYNEKRRGDEIREYKCSISFDEIEKKIETYQRSGNEPYIWVADDIVPTMYTSAGGYCERLN